MRHHRRWFLGMRCDRGEAIMGRYWSFFGHLRALFRPFRTRSKAMSHVVAAWRMAFACLPRAPLGAVTFLALACHSTLVCAETPRALEQQFAEALEQENHQSVAVLADALIKQKNPPPPELYYHRARALFCLNRVEEAVEDFDRYVELRPALASRQWERGIACFYAGRYEDGAKQFELYQTYHDNDVENSVWRFLCLVPQVGVEKARETMLPIRRDPRVPMMEIYETYRGNWNVLHVSLATFADRPSIEQLEARTFYARLYMGLYYQYVERDDESAHLLLSQAVEQYRDNRQINRFMWSVADIHMKRARPGTLLKP